MSALDNYRFRKQVGQLFILGDANVSKKKKKKKVASLDSLFHVSEVDCWETFDKTTDGY